MQPDMAPVTAKLPRVYRNIRCGYTSIRAIINAHENRSFFVVHHTEGMSHCTHHDDDDIGCQQAQCESTDSMRPLAA